MALSARSAGRVTLNSHHASQGRPGSRESCKGTGGQSGLSEPFPVAQTGDSGSACAPSLHEGGASSPRSTAPSIGGWLLCFGDRGTHLELVLVGGRFPCAGHPRWAQALLQVVHGDERAGCKGTAQYFGI